MPAKIDDAAAPTHNPPMPRRLPRRSRPLTRPAVTSAAAAAVVAVLSAAGCSEEGTATAQARADLERASAYLDSSGADEQLRGKAVAALEAASGLDSARPAARAQAYRLLGLAEETAGDVLAAEAAAKRAAASRTAFEILTLADSAAYGGRSIEAMRLLDPAPTLETVDTLTAEVQGDGGGGQWQAGDVAFPTLAGVRQEISRVEGQIAELENRRSGLEERRNALLEEAAARFGEADRAAGDEGVRLFTEGADRQAEAGQVAAEVTGVDAELRPLRQELRRLQTQQDVLAQTVEALGEARASLVQRRERLSAEIDEQRQVLAGILSGDEESVDARAVELEGLLAGEDGADAVLDAAAVAYTRAADNYDRAVQQARAAGSGGGEFGADVRRSITAMLAQPTFDTLRGNALASRGLAEASAAKGESSRLLAADAVAAAGASAQGYTTPDVLAPDTVRGRLEALTNQASETLTQATEALDAARNGSFGAMDRDEQQAVRRAAAVSAASAYFTRAQVADLAARVLGDQDAAASAEEFLSQARTLLAETEGVRQETLPQILRSTGTPPADGGFGEGEGGDAGAFGGDTPAEDPAADIDAAPEDQPPAAETDGAEDAGAMDEALDAAEDVGAGQE